MKLSTDYFQNGNILKSNDQLKTLVADLQRERNEALEANCRLRKANLELSSINAQLEAVIEKKSGDIHSLNRKIVRFAQYNAHRIRGPLARIIGLVQIINLDFMNKKIHDREQFEFCLQGLKKNATELDEMIKAVTMLLNENGVSAEEIEMSSRFKKYIRKTIRNFFRLMPPYYRF